MLGLEPHEQFGSLRGRDDASPYFCVSAKLLRPFLREYELLEMTMQATLLSFVELRIREPAGESLANES